MSFEFKRFGKTIASASNIVELEEKIEQLVEIDPGCVEHHIREGHISSWLYSIGESDLARELMNTKTSTEAAATIRKYLSDKKMLMVEQPESSVTVCTNIHLVD